MIRISQCVVLGTICAVLGAAADSACAAGVSAAIAAAVADAGRPAADKDRDADRKPAESLAFAGVKPGLVVGELLPGGGYFTRLISKVVGATGHVYAVVPPRPPTAPADRPDMAARVKVIADDPAYGNVTVIVGPLADFSLPAPVDLFWTSQNYHDLHNIPGMDLTTFNKRVFDALKPGGIYLVLDHAAAAGSGARDTSTMHRIDVETVKQEVLAAGFVLAGSSDILHRADDPHTAPVRDATVHGKTDQFILKFRKPVTLR
jgi:predicted methyltransferase